MERYMYNDIRVFQAILEAKKNDKSFTEKGFLGMLPKYKQHEVREIWFEGIALGIEKGLEIGSYQGQKVELYNNTITPKQKEFLDKFYKLAEEYNCAILYHPHEGMCVMDLNRE